MQMSARGFCDTLNLYSTVSLYDKYADWNTCWCEKCLRVQKFTFTGNAKE